MTDITANTAADKPKDDAVEPKVIKPYTQPRLSKSRIMAGLQCPKRLWLETYHRELIHYEPSSHSAFAQGDAFGVLARSLIEADCDQVGTLIEAVREPVAALTLTQQALAGDPALLFEPAFKADNVFVRADALIRESAQSSALSDEPRYTMVEVKASASIKASHVRDCAVQTWVARACGLNVTRIELAHVDNQFSYSGDGYQGLLKRVDITAQIESQLPDVSGWVHTATTTLQSPDTPDVAMGKHCYQPYPCPFVAHCTATCPAPAAPAPQFPITLLPSIQGKSLAKNLQAQGYEDLLTVPADKLGRFAFVQTAYANNQPFFDAQAAKTLLNAQPKPWAYFDFETVSPAIPLWRDTKPFAHWPFQWSAHVEAANGALAHHDFLDLSGANPATGCIPAMLAATQSAKTIWAYNASFERQAIMRLAAAYPADSVALTQMANKLQDLIPIVQACYYHPAMMGSYSIKSVLPAIAPELSYANLDGVKDGNAAQGAFFEAIAVTTPPERKAEIRAQLLAYCQLDTWAMVVLVARLLQQELPTLAQPV